MAKRVDYRIGTPADLGPITTLLREVNLPAEGLSVHLENFITAKADDKVVGVIGLEALGEIGLFRPPRF